VGGLTRELGGIRIDGGKPCVQVLQMAELGPPVQTGPRRRTISSLSLAQSPSKPGTATVQNHGSQWLQLPPASSRQESGPKISLRVPVR
jgi:hypothetical protein